MIDIITSIRYNFLVRKDYDMSEEVKQMQDDEREALISIYEGDDAFKQVNPTTYQYKVSS